MKVKFMQYACLNLFYTQENQEPTFAGTTTFICKEMWIIQYLTFMKYIIKLQHNSSLQYVAI